MGGVTDINSGNNNVCRFRNFEMPPSIEQSAGGD